MNSTIKTIAIIAALMAPATTHSQDSDMENKNSFYYSRKGADIGVFLDKRTTIAKLEDGSEVIYTEMVNPGRSPISRWDDLVFLGKGEFLRIER